MKKLKLSLTNVKEVLSRDQLRQVVGGMGSGNPNCPQGDLDIKRDWICCGDGKRYKDKKCVEITCVGILTTDETRCH